LQLRKRIQNLYLSVLAVILALFANFEAKRAETTQKTKKVFYI